MKDISAGIDSFAATLDASRPTSDGMSGKGFGEVCVYGPDGALKQRVEFENLITQYGDQVYAELGSGAAAPNAPTGMRLGTGATAAAKTGAGAAIVTYTVVNSSFAFDSTPTSALNGSARRITYVRTFAPGEATENGIQEAVITNENPITDVAGTAGNTIARATFTAVNKAAGDTLTVTWTHDFEAA